MVAATHMEIANIPRVEIPNVAASTPHPIEQLTNYPKAG